MGLPTLERIFCLAPAALLLGGAIGGIVGFLAFFANLQVFGGNFGRRAKLICSTLVFALAWAVYLIVALNWRQHVSLGVKEAVGAVCLVAGGVYFTFEFVRGMIVKSVPDPLTGFMTRATRSENPRRFIGGMTLMGFFTLCFALLTYAFLFLK